MPRRQDATTAAPIVEELRASEIQIEVSRTTVKAPLRLQVPILSLIDPISGVKPWMKQSLKRKVLELGDPPGTLW